MSQKLLSDLTALTYITCLDSFTKKGKNGTWTTDHKASPLTQVPVYPMLILGF